MLVDVIVDGFVVVDGAVEVSATFVAHVDDSTLHLRPPDAEVESSTTVALTSTAPSTTTSTVNVDAHVQAPSAAHAKRARAGAISTQRRKGAKNAKYEFRAALLKIAARSPELCGSATLRESEVLN